MCFAREAIKSGIKPGNLWLHPTIPYFQEQLITYGMPLVFKPWHLLFLNNTRYEQAYARPCSDESSWSFASGQFKEDRRSSKQGMPLYFPIIFELSFPQTLFAKYVYEIKTSKPPFSLSNLPMVWSFSSLRTFFERSLHILYILSCNFCVWSLVVQLLSLFSHEPYMRMAAIITFLPSYSHPATFKQPFFGHFFKN